jgi:hypothetical protein
MQKQVYDETQRILGKLELVDLVRWQINRCNVSAGDEMLFDRNVVMLMNMLPSNRLAEIKNLESDYIDEGEVWVYKHKGGKNLGSIERPFYRNTEDDPNWDGREPILVSPIKTKVKTINYDKLYTLVLRLLEEAGLTWREEQIEIESGKVDFTEEPDTENPHPTYGDDVKN